jgi:hypothetical protein
MRKTLLAGLPLIIVLAFAGGVHPSASEPAAKNTPKKKVLRPSQLEQVEETKPKSARAPEPSVPEQEAGPIGVFADVETGWKSEQVQQILRHYPKGKVAISIEGSSPTGGQFSRNQSYYLFQDLFKYTITEKFQFVQYRHVSDGRDKVYAVAERHFRRNDDGRLFKDKIYVSLHLEDDRWVISEIKSTR